MLEKISMHFKFSKKMLYNPTKIWYNKDIPLFGYRYSIIIFNFMKITNRK